LLSMPVGIATALAVLLHEIPQEIGDFWVLIHWWYSKTKALKLNFLSALTAFVWVLLALILQKYVDDISAFLMPFSAWLFIYIAWTDLIPELHKHPRVSQSLLQALCFILGIWVMCLLLLVE
jgi:zinc and cadmium transporter